MIEWHPIAFAPSDRDLELSVTEEGEVHSLAFPCRRTQSGWVCTSTGGAGLCRPEALARMVRRLMTRLREASSR
jgi:hypothetical protein